jgi:hypothetical protein
MGTNTARRWNVAAANPQVRERYSSLCDCRVQLGVRDEAPLATALHAESASFGKAFDRLLKKLNQVRKSRLVRGHEAGRLDCV